MANMLALIKKAAVEAVVASKPMNMAFGKVVGASPFKIQIDQQLTLDEDFLVFTQRGKESLEVGDKVVMLVAQGGQSYLVLDKVV
ncbi:DUF2577 domain-containing protein [Fusibacter bizertensis]